MSFAGNREPGSVNQTYIAPDQLQMVRRLRSANDLRLERRRGQRMDDPDGRGRGQSVQRRITCDEFSGWRV